MIPVEGDTVVAHLDKSHVTVHTYPEYHPDTCLATFRVDIDVATCGEITPLSTLDYLIGSFDSDIITMDYRVRGFTRDVAGKKLFMDHKITSIQDYIDTETLQRYDAVDINVYQANLFHTKMLIKEIDLQNYLFNTDVYELPPKNPPGHHRQPAEGNDRGVQRKQHLLSVWKVFVNGVAFIQINASVRPQKQAVVLAVRVAIPHQRVENELLCPLPHQQATVRLPFQQGKRIGSSHGILRMPRNAQRLREILNMDAPNLPVGANLAIEPFDDISLIFAERPHKRPRNVQPARCRKVHGRIFHQRGAAKALMGRLHDVGRRMLGVRPGPAVVEPLQGEFALRTRKGETTAAIIGPPRRPTSPEPVNLDRDVLFPCEFASLGCDFPLAREST